MTFEQDVAALQRRLQELERQARRPHRLTHEMSGGDTVRISGMNGGTHLNRQRSLNAGTGLTMTEVQGADPYLNLAVTSNADIPTAGEKAWLTNGLAGQIAFPATQNPSAGANTLDDYEEGAWTPAASFATMGTAAQVVQVGSYTKIGNRVLFQGRLDFTKGTASGAFTITGLPFANSGTANNFSSCSLRVDGMAAAGFVMAYISPGGSAITLSNQSGGAAADLTAAGFGASTVIIFGGQYGV